MPQISTDDDRHVFLLETPSSSYVLVAAPGSQSVRHVHWGQHADLASASEMASASILPHHVERIAWGEEQPLEYTPWGGPRYDEPSLKVDFADGTRGLEWRVGGSEVEMSGDGSSTLTVSLADEAYPLTIGLCYRVFDDTDVIERWARIANTSTDTPFTIRQAHSANWWLPSAISWGIRYLHGAWGCEHRIADACLHPGKFVLESRRGTTSHEMAPWFALSARGEASEHRGEVYSGSLAWSGNWKIVIETTPGGLLHATGGLNDFDSPISLDPGAALTLPVFAGLFTEHGFGGMSRAWHDYQLRHVLRHGARSGHSPSFPAGIGAGRPDEARAISIATRRAAESHNDGSPDTTADLPPVRPVLYNSWEATGFQVSETGQRQLAERAADIGVELFVVDDGWFTKRCDDRAALGDWTVDAEKFPSGLGPLISHVKDLGMGFGLWIEPEMTNPDSELYRAHPDWVVHFARRQRSERRNQLVLNLARDEVAAWVARTLDQLLSQHDIDFVKWDMNRHLSEPGWPAEAGRNPERLWLDYTSNLYSILDEIRRKHPGVEFESCSGGGGRVDNGILSRTEQVWTSDNTDAHDRVTIQEGFTQAWPPQAMMAWVTDSPNPLTQRSLPLTYRFHVAMAGALGIGGNLMEWTAEERAEARRLVAIYKQIRTTVQHGRLFRLSSLRDSRLGAVQYVARDGAEAVIIAASGVRSFGPLPSRLRLAGLDPMASYAERDTGQVWRGTTLQSIGIALPDTLDYMSVLVHLERIP